MTMGEALDLGERELTEAGIEDGGEEAKILLSELTGIGRLDFFLKKEESLSEDIKRQYLTFLEKRKKRIPLQMILGYTEFMGLQFEVSPATLVPRADTEVVCETALLYLTEGSTILDLCTGTGCVLLSLLKMREGTSGVGTDISADAVELSEINAKRLGLSGRAKFLKGDLYAPLPAGSCFDLIIANPPYIKSDVIKDLMPEVRDYEPRRALDGGADGLIYYRRIAADAKKFLAPSGLLLFETGYDQGEQVTEILKENGFSNIILKKDYGGNVRVCGGFLQREP
ncbi:MAG: peptide chain release factor N(5)-glutamine methyltransferase [Lachnospiraceae bacterium]|nr:peptide chain release factor N(5)-glutamine methyltransferase [Lachnospiraceae bacterium]